jgi:hypothetical protein
MRRNRLNAYHTPDQPHRFGVCITAAITLLLVLALTADVWARSSGGRYGGRDSPNRAEALRAVAVEVRYPQGPTAVVPPAAVPPLTTLPPCPAQGILSPFPSPCPAQGSALRPLRFPLWGGVPGAEVVSAWAGSSGS